MLFDEKKTYFLVFKTPEGKKLFFTATNIFTTETLISFFDKKKQQFVFELSRLEQATEQKAGIP